ncbi:Rossmann-like and DUF2520 domain-containing protein [Sphingobium bisphenolivorans]|uniref:Rossmann-like and DUF2520 domain-containing protein n=1 Tax=Sphingobium bisphenolivorans TaxID=1335760 RepID=UPI0003A9B5C2|nr:Rossmann-like and DUF2520 domain-containing protein [Sphingobium bisphenolivorans]
MDTFPPYRRIGIIGTGRVASAIGLSLAGHSIEPLVLWGRTPANSAATSAAIGRARPMPRIVDIAATCDLIVLAVADDALKACIHELSAAPTPTSPLVFHVSGQSGAAILSPLTALGWLTAAIHPAMTFTGDPQAEVQSMVGARFGVTGSTPQANAAARAIVSRLGGVPVEVSEESRPLYHAALCHGANHLVTLIAGACEALTAAGVDDPAALLAPLVRTALENSLSKGMMGLSGPLLRGDEETIGGHLSALRKDCPPLFPPYQAMALATLDALERSNGTAQSACRSMLGEAR